MIATSVSSFAAGSGEGGASLLGLARVANAVTPNSALKTSRPATSW